MCNLWPLGVFSLVFLSLWKLCTTKVNLLIQIFFCKQKPPAYAGIYQQKHTNCWTVCLWKYSSLFQILIPKCLRKTYLEDLWCFCCKHFSCLGKFIFLTLLLCQCLSNRVALGMAANHLLLSLLIWQLGDGCVSLINTLLGRDVIYIAQKFISLCRSTDTPINCFFCIFSLQDRCCSNLVGCEIVLYMHIQLPARHSFP